jgi:hypothetical protein
MNLRKNVRNLSDQELTDLRTAYGQMMQIRDNRPITNFSVILEYFCSHFQIMTCVLFLRGSKDKI